MGLLLFILVGLSTYVLAYLALLFVPIYLFTISELGANALAYLQAYFYSKGYE